MRICHAIFNHSCHSILLIYKRLAKAQRVHAYLSLSCCKWTSGMRWIPYDCCDSNGGNILLIHQLNYGLTCAQCALRSTVRTLLKMNWIEFAVKMRKLHSIKNNFRQQLKVNRHLKCIGDVIAMNKLLLSLNILITIAK